MKSLILFALFAVFLLLGCNSTQPGMQSAASTPPVTPTVSGNFVAVGNMNTPRANHAAILLPNGTVLIAGGNSGLAPSAELYDPSARTFTPTGSMAVPRDSPGAVLLANGKVLIVGGSQDLRAEVYDPSTGAFTSAGSLVSGGNAYNALDSRLPTLLQDGRVLVEGVNAEIYDPATGAFSLTAAYAYADADPTWFTSTLLQDGTVLLTGCLQACSSGVTEIYDPRANTFGAAGPLLQYGFENTATLLTNGKVLFVSSDDDDIFSEAELYDPTGGFASIGSRFGTHEYSAAVRLSNGTVLITGGQLPGGSGNEEADLVDSSTGMVVTAGNMTAGRQHHTATLLPDGTVLITGGYTTWPGPTNTAEIYKP